jgi:hypothetical protein
MTLQSRFINNDVSVVRITIRSATIANIGLFQGEENAVSGPDGASFVYAWKDRDELISEDEVSAFGVEVGYGHDISFGDPKGKVP